jgi:hypothetical protein
VFFLTYGSLRQPFQYAGKSDPLQMLTWVKAASEGHWIPLLDRTNPRLGAPDGANWNDFPMYDAQLIWVFGLVARATSLFTGANLLLLCGHLTSALGFLAACRMLRVRWTWAVGFALVWSFSCYHAFRGLGHALLSWDYAVPLAVVCSWRVADQPVPFRLGGKFFWCTVALSAAIGQGNPYSVIMWCELLALSALARWWSGRGKDGLCFAGVLVGVTLASLVLSNLPCLIEGLRHGFNPYAVPRTYFQTELYALKPIDLLLPPFWHRLPELAQIGARYKEAVWVRGEMFSPYLGVVGIVGLAWLTGAFLRRFLRGQPTSWHFPQVVWVLLWSCIGGGNCLLAFCGLQVWRGSDRFSIWILAICLLWLAVQLSQRLGRRQWLSASLALGVAGLAVFDQFDVSHTRDAKDDAALAQKDQQFGEQLEARLAGKRVFQVPVMNFIDADPVGSVKPYDLTRPYLWTKTVRFSHGRIFGRPEDSWRLQIIAGSTPAQLAVLLRQRGFSAVLLDRNGFKDAGESALAGLAAAGYREVIEDQAHEWACVIIE